MKVELPEGYNEESYLDANPDVKGAVKSGQFQSGAAHYILHGYKERRRISKEKERLALPEPLKRPFLPNHVPSRRDYILANLDLKNMLGIEIGALASPLVQRNEGKIIYVDHADSETLKQKYINDPSVNIDEIVYVDAIWGEKSLNSCIGPDQQIDYVVASHVIEHVPDFISWLNEVTDVLRPGGTLRLAVPDKRYTFDILRNETQLHDVLDAYLHKTRIPLPRMIIEHHNLVRHVDCSAAWKGTLNVKKLEPGSSLDYGIKAAKSALELNSYHDVHCWVFTPNSFKNLCLELTKLGLIKLEIYCLDETLEQQNEFYVNMIK